MIRILICHLLFLIITISASCQNANSPERWEDEVKAYELQDSLNDAPTSGILFTGSSSIRLWEDLPKRFPGKRVINRGIGGSEISDIIFYADRLIYPYRPNKIFIYCGGNDIWNGKSPEVVLNDFKNLYSKIKHKLPNTKVYYISIQAAPSRMEKKESFKRANELIKAYLANNTQDVFIDVFPLLLDQNGEPKPEFFIEDQLHMNHLGYDRWTRVIKPYVEK